MTTQPEAISAKSLLSDVKRIVNHQNELEIVKGEKFNVFTILGMESRENGTHSAFLGELLNPKGSHLLGATFLNLFLETIDFEEVFDIKTAALVLEKHIGLTDLSKKTGGRIDIYLVDDLGRSISIENKIYASDQPAQIERYVNHNKGHNSVYYLTLNGASPSDESKGELLEQENFKCISYHTTIVNWLDKCLKESTEHPIVRESIKQYILLIKKLTNQLADTQMENEINTLIKSNYTAAKAIQSGVEKVELQTATDFVKAVQAEIIKELKDPWAVKVDVDLSVTWSGLEITRNDWHGIRIVLEGQSRIPWNNTVYGIHAAKDRWNREPINEALLTIDFLNDFKESYHWPRYKSIFTFASTENRARLFDAEEREKLVQEVSTSLIELAKMCENSLKIDARINS